MHLKRQNELSTHIAASAVWESQTTSAKLKIMMQINKPNYL